MERSRESKERILGQYWQASELYEQAIQGARDNQYLHEEAIAYELATEFYFALGREKIAETYLFFREKINV